jgi:hypothetical protein
MRRIAFDTKGDDDDEFDNLYVFGCAEAVSGTGVSFHRINFDDDTDY